MNNVILSYESLWLYYKHAGEEVQKDILKQLDLDSFVPRISGQAREEVLKYAPPEIKERFSKTAPPTRQEETIKKLLGGKHDYFIERLIGHRDGRKRT